MKTEEEVRKALADFKERNKGNFLRRNEVEEIIGVFEWILEEAK